MASGLLWLLLVGPGTIEGRLFPASAPMKLDQLVQTEQGTAIWGRSARLRSFCSFREIKWYLGERGAKNVPAKVQIGPLVVRADGPFSFGPWVVDISPAERVRDFSFADVYHHCRVGPVWMPWLTKTRFWN